tara:strand:+ start:6905 stop:8170 length:1266 start_codon:yes stop_codon:yes gene_type:complete
MQLKDALEEINRIPQIPNYIPSLERIESAIQHLYGDLRTYAKQMITIAGTNGKGSVAKSLETFFLESGQDCALFTSPHLIRINERIRFAGKEITDEEFLHHYMQVRPAVRDYQLSHFEILCIIALDYFMPKIKMGATCIWEVGMGGRWDATNSIPHDTSILCPIGYDHQKYLGNTLEEIAANKFDIVQEGNQVFSVRYPESLQALLEKKCQVQGASLHTIDEDWIQSFQYDYNENYEFFLRYDGNTYPNSLSGKRGFENLVYAYFIWSHLQDKWQKQLSASSKIQWPHRFSSRYSEVFQDMVYFSGDHNVQGIHSLVEILNCNPQQKWLVLMALTEGRDPNGMFDPIFDNPNCELLLCQSPFRAQTLEDYKRWRNWEAWNGKYFASAKEAILYMKEVKQADQRVLICGSLYLTGHIDEILR